MPEHQEQRAGVAGLIPAPLGRLDLPFNLPHGEVLSVAAIPACVSAFAPVQHFVERYALQAGNEYGEWCLLLLFNNLNFFLSHPVQVVDEAVYLTI